MAANRRDDDDDDDDKKEDRNDRDEREEIKYASKMPKRKYAYFRDDQITFLVTHPGSEISDDDLEAFRTEITRRLEPWDARITKKSIQAISFPGLTDQELKQINGLSREDRERVKEAFSIIKCELRNGPKDPAELIKIVERLTKQLSQKSIGNLTIRGTSPNWITSVAAQGGATGGPGGRPSPYYGSRQNATYRFDFIPKLKTRRINLYDEGEGVDVVILDTAPSAQALVSAYKEWPDHPIIATLLGPKGKLRLYPATYDELWEMNCTSLNDHDYKMTDHGLFVAGIIHSIAPKANIHLIEVLNQYGAGDFTNLVHGLQKIYTENIYKPDGKLVINCSWMLDFPLDDLHCRHMDQFDDLDANFEKEVRDFSKSDPETLQMMLEYLFNRFFGLGKQAIAAAGNDSRAEDTKRTPARYPAALKTVTGVGALPKDLRQDSSNLKKYVPSVFSNFSESANYQGVVNRGVVTLGGEEGEGKGVLGLYIGEFPGCCRNDSKWAWWAGTSFAAPILTGTVAAILSRQRNNITRTQDVIDKLIKKVKLIKEGKAGREGKGGRQENAWPVKQC